MRWKYLYLIKHKVKIDVRIRATVIDDFAYIFVRNLLHAEGDMLTASFIAIHETGT
jgi:hypothetical protein